MAAVGLAVEVVLVAVEDPLVPMVELVVVGPPEALALVPAPDQMVLAVAELQELLLLLPAVLLVPLLLVP